MKTLPATIIAAVVVLLNLSCSEKEDILTDNNTYIKNASIRWQGDYAVDGCGFFVDIDNKTYKPENEEIIGEDFKTDHPVPALLEIKFLERKVEYYCGDLPYINKIEGIRILSITVKP